MTLSAPAMVCLLRAAGESTRLRVLALLAEEELAVMELVQILGQSQPRVSRHLKLLADAGLVERFPDGALVFYRLAAAGPGRRLLDFALGLMDRGSSELRGDLQRLENVRVEREEEAAAYFARNAARWDEVRSLYVDEGEVEAAILAAAGPGPFDRLIDLGTGTGRMLSVLGPRARTSIGLDLSQNMLNIARRNVSDVGLSGCALRHGDIYATGLEARSADLVVIHRVLHFLADPGAAVGEAGRLLRPGGQLLIVDFAPHQFEQLRLNHQHRRLGFSDEEIRRWAEGAGLDCGEGRALPPTSAEGLTVKIWRMEACASGGTPEGWRRA